MLILAAILFIFAIALLKEGSSDAAKTGVIVLIVALAIAAFNINTAMIDKAVLAIGNVIAPVCGLIFSFLENVLRFFAVIFVFIFLGPILLLFGKK